MKIKNWKKFQHFKDRNPPWIKLHREILYQRDINMISDCSFRVLVYLWMLASEDVSKEGNLPPIEDIAWRLRMDEKKIMQSIQELSEWVEHDDINTISPRYQVVPTETETETETEKIMSVKKNNRLIYSDNFQEFWKYASKHWHKTPSGNKMEAYSEWKKHKPELDVATDSWTGYYLQCKKTDTPTRHICRWLKNRGFDQTYKREETTNTMVETIKVSKYG